MNSRTVAATLLSALLLAGCQTEIKPAPASLTPQSSTVLVESKWTLRDDQAALTRSRLNLATSNAEVRSVYFYDTTALELYQQGLILRARKVKDGDDDSTVKFRPMTLAQAGDYIGQSGFKCEIDAVGTQEVSSCSLTTIQPTGQIDDVRQGLLSIKKLYSSEQESFAQSQVAVDWAALEVLGPTMSNVWKKSVSSLKYPYTVEQWTLPSGAVITEVSTKTTQADAASAASALKNYLINKGLIISTAQETKTRRTLSEWAALQ